MQLKVGRSIGSVAEGVPEPHPRHNPPIVVNWVNENGGQLPVLVRTDHNDRRRL
ncbi:hypothetical protein [Cryobacterium sp. Sr8]|uniref:hypothetical protein n=1 Tax=Cryobacterium sp. Sr8 TaxID=1259203 RepID=UPI00141AD775|nr:hypothetical protein [Cryobacterium sp. Sr8]